MRNRYTPTHKYGDGYTHQIIIDNDSGHTVIYGNSWGFTLAYANHLNGDGPKPKISDFPDAWCRTYSSVHDQCKGQQQ